MKIKSLPEDERPREKMKKNGSASLTDAELLAIILQTGRRNEDVLDMSTRLLQTFDLKRLSRASITVLEKHLGIGIAKACQISAGFELGRRLSRFKEKKIRISGAKDIASLLMDEMRALTKEYLKVVFLNTKRRILRIETLFVGSLNESVIHPREIFQYALEESAAAIILVHNHPSGDATPSHDDIQATKQIVDAGDLLGIPVLDHIVIGEKAYVSMREKKLL